MPNSNLAERRTKILGLLKDEQRSVKVAAAKALESIDARIAVDAMLADLAEGKPVKQVKALHGLAGVRDPRVGPTLSKALYNEREDIQATAARLLGEYGDRRAVDPLLGRLKKPAAVPVQEGIAEALGALGDPKAVDPLLGLIESGTPGLRAVVLRALGEIGDARAESTILAHLKSKDPDLRAAAAVALAQLS